MSNDDEYDEVSSSTSIQEDDRVENYNNIEDDDDNNDDDDDDDEQPLKKPRQLSLAELEDFEEARQAALELEELESTATSSSTLQTSLTSSSASMVSNADSASSMTSTAANAALSVSSSNTIYAPSSSSITTFNADDGNNNNNNNLPQTTAATYVPNTPQQEIDLAQKRDVLQNTRLNEMFAEEDAMTANRQAQIRALLDEDDKVWKEERRKRMLGKYATVESWEEVERLMEEDRRKEAQGMCCVYFLLLELDCL